MVALANDTMTSSQLRRRPRQGALWALGTGVARWLQARREAEELAQLDWRELKDIGLTAADVQVLIDKPFWRA